MPAVQASPGLTGEAALSGVYVPGSHISGTERADDVVDLPHLVVVVWTKGSIASLVALSHETGSCPAV